MSEQPKKVGYAQFGLKEIEKNLKTKKEMRQVLIIIEGERLYIAQEVPIMIMELFEGTGKIVYWAMQFVPIDPENLLNTVDITVNRWNEFSREYQAFKEGSRARALVFWTHLTNQKKHLVEDGTFGEILKVQALAWKTFRSVGEAGYNLPEYFRYDPVLGRVFPRTEVLTNK